MSAIIPKDINPSPKIDTTAFKLMTTPHYSADSVSGNKQIHLYQIDVKMQGSFVAQHFVEAIDALTAINLVESYYGEPVQVETVVVEDEDGDLRQKIVIKNWHGYTFDARIVNP
jgi:hypothetical protein